MPVLLESVREDEDKSAVAAALTAAAEFLLAGLEPYNAPMMGLCCIYCYVLPKHLVKGARALPQWAVTVCLLCHCCFYVTLLIYRGLMTFVPPMPQARPGASARRRHRSRRWCCAQRPAARRSGVTRRRRRRRARARCAPPCRPYFLILYKKLRYRGHVNSRPSAPLKYLSRACAEAKLPKMHEGDGRLALHSARRWACWCKRTAITSLSLSRGGYETGETRRRMGTRRCCRRSGS